MRNAVVDPAPNEPALSAAPAPKRKPWYRHLYAQVIIAVVIGILIGAKFPETGKALKPLGDGFILLVKMMIAPIIFCTVVHGIASMGELRKLGRLGFKALLYFEVVSTIALVIGLIVVNAYKPGVGFNIDLQTLDPSLTEKYAQQAKALSAVGFLLHIIPETFLQPFVTGDLLQILLISILMAFAITALREKGAPLLHAIDRISEAFFAVMRMVVKLAPLGALGAMAFTVGSYGVASLQRLLDLMICFYVTAITFIVFVLGAIAWKSGFSIFKFLRFIKDELLLVLGTSSSETALPGMIEKMQRLGCARSTTGLVIPTGYSFNLDGTNIYMSMAAIFLAQATNTPLSLGQQIQLLLVAMITSKGASGVTGAGFITLAATLAALPSIPIASLALLVGIDRFMSECRALTNLIGNGVATVAISRWEGEVSKDTLRSRLDAPE
ncbi:MAG: dicarboxylate/amino acid:cation symporter [Verrucomicrobia subdivision 3 bacterium]|nr:dicarboxylate/amino acid:cation symporter [Limisphaerales bacterium]